MKMLFFLFALLVVCESFRTHCLCKEGNLTCVGTTINQRDLNACPSAKLFNFTHSVLSTCRLSWHQASLIFLVKVDLKYKLDFLV